MKDFFTFKRMITPLIIYTLFWLAVLTCLGVGIRDFFHKEFALGFSVIILGPIIARLIAEFFILFFRMNETLTEINNNIVKSAK